MEILSALGPDFLIFLVDDFQIRPEECTQVCSLIFEHVDLRVRSPGIMSCLKMYMNSTLWINGLCRFNIACADTFDTFK